MTAITDHSAGVGSNRCPFLLQLMLLGSVWAGIVPQARAVDLGAALDNSEIPFVSTYPWALSPDAKAGGTSLSSGVVPVGQPATLTGTVGSSGWLTFWRKAAPGTQAIVSVYNSWRLQQADGWVLEALPVRYVPWAQTVTWEVAPGGSLLIDRVAVTAGLDLPLPQIGLSEAFPIAGADWRTSSRRPFRAYSGPGLAPGSFAVCEADEGLDSWLETEITGPGTLTFSARTIGAREYDPRMLGLEMDGRAVMADASGFALVTGLAGLVPDGPMRLSIPAGRHVVRWTFSWQGASVLPAMLLHGVSFAPSPAFEPVASTARTAFLHSADSALQFLSDAGQPCVRMVSAPATGTSGDDYVRPVLRAPVTGPGWFSFRYRAAAPWPEGVWGNVRIVSPVTGAGSGSTWPYRSADFSFTGTSAWQEARIFLNPGVSHWHLELPARSLVLDLSDIRIDLATPVGLAEALGVPGRSFASSPGLSWSGIRQSDGTGLALAPLASSMWDPPGWMETTVNGPAMISWQSWRSYSATRESVQIDDTETWPNRYWEAPPPGVDEFTSSQILVPAGVHVVRWSMGGAAGRLSAIGAMKIAQVSSAYAAWSLTVPPSIENGRILPPMPGDDEDHDGASNLAEFAFRTDPNTSASAPGIDCATDAGGLLVSVPAFRPAGDGISCVLESSADLITWTPAAATITAADSSKVHFRIHDTPAPRRCLRARVSFVP